MRGTVAEIDSLVKTLQIRDVRGGAAKQRDNVEGFTGASFQPESVMIPMIALRETGLTHFASRISCGFEDSLQLQHLQLLPSDLCVELHGLGLSSDAL